jgi:hypothetical protein
LLLRLHGELQVIRALTAELLDLRATELGGRRGLFAAVIDCCSCSSCCCCASCCT